MSFQARVDHALDRGMPGEEPGESQRRAVLLPDTEGERQQPPVEEEAGVGVQTPTEMIETVPDALDLLPSANHAARRDIVVPVQVFRAAVERQVEPHLQGSKVHGRGERVVNEGEQVVRSGKANDCRQVRDIEERIREIARTKGRKRRKVTEWALSDATTCARTIDLSF